MINERVYDHWTDVVSKAVDEIVGCMDEHARRRLRRVALRCDSRLAGASVGVARRSYWTNYRRAPVNSRPVGPTFPV